MTTFIYPTDVTRITSMFRTSDRPNHHGVDFAQAGTHTIKAVADGEVSKSYRSPTYGEVVFIEHNIAGQVWETVYAHMREGSRSVRAGSKVKQGQTLGIMGNTGDSTGQHLHFELHKGLWNIKKSNAVNPLNYLGQAEQFAKVQLNPYKGYSVVDYLKSINIDSSIENRRKLAEKHGVKNYDLSAVKNIELLKKMRGF